MVDDAAAAVSAVYPPVENSTPPPPSADSVRARDADIQKLLGSFLVRSYARDLCVSS